jgi:hypothetical protein
MARKAAPKKASAKKPVRKASTPRATAAAKRTPFVTGSAPLAHSSL